jgi:hypothetical protein
MWKKGEFMFWIKVILILVWFIAGLFLFAKDVVKDLPFLAPVFNIFGLLGDYQVTKVIKPAASKVVEVVEVEEDAKEESVDEDNALENVQIFKTKIVARTTWYASLTPAEKAEFRSYFVDEGEKHLIKDLEYKLNGNNDAFFERVFNFIYAYRKLISNSLLEKLTDELLFFAEKDPEVQTLIYEAATRVAYFRRKDKAMLAFAEKLARLDVALQQGELKAEDKYVYSFTRLAIILERKGDIKEALTLVNDALKRKLTDRTKTDYEGRKVRLQKRLEAKE